MVATISAIDNLFDIIISGDLMLNLLMHEQGLKEMIESITHSHLSTVIVDKIE